ncbi:hypothetical protein M433DRAFT_64993 [Acidomyces richmondensis BFW]|nr:MAG: hypothetical protein FE78DRAFT_78664 [Acidomyces sp. 'richmondensis']KYG46488.1 hypothetical protein M433DRAFT_64993 [Acidomyces richmondensis BFW]
MHNPTSSTSFRKWDSPVVIDLTQDTPPRKRKSRNISEEDDKDDTNNVAAQPRPKRPKNPVVDDNSNEEKRLRRWRKHPPASYLEVRSRALTQRMFALDRRRDYDSTADHPIETIALAGTTGNIYTIVIDKVPSCNCPHARKGNQCKHLAYVLSRVLRAPAHLEYQLAFTSAELREIFAGAPLLPSETVGEGKEDGEDKQKPLEGECPICVCDFEPESREAVVYCRAACGNNVHRGCFEQWAATKKRGGEAVTCPFCRALWEDEKEYAGKIPCTGIVNEEGYVNVAAQLGLSGRRDYSTYHSHWVMRQVEQGRIAWDG